MQYEDIALLVGYLCILYLVLYVCYTLLIIVAMQCVLLCYKLGWLLPHDPMEYWEHLIRYLWSMRVINYLYPIGYRELRFVLPVIWDSMNYLFMELQGEALFHLFMFWLDMLNFWGIFIDIVRIIAIGLLLRMMEGERHIRFAMPPHRALE